MVEFIAPAEYPYVMIMMGQEDTLHQLLEEVAEAENTDMTELPKLGRTIDTDAIQDVLESAEQARVSFEYAGYDVDITNSDFSIQER